VKLLRGLTQHPNSKIRVKACRDLLLVQWGQDECWDALTETERTHLTDGGYIRSDVNRERQRIHERGLFWWRTYTDRDERRMLTAVSERSLREQFCRLYIREYPGDRDHGCPADRPPPATIVTDRGDVPLVGGWPY